MEVHAHKTANERQVAEQDIAAEPQKSRLEHEYSIEDWLMTKYGRKVNFLLRMTVD